MHTCALASLYVQRWLDGASYIQPILYVGPNLSLLLPATAGPGGVGALITGRPGIDAPRLADIDATLTMLQGPISTLLTRVRSCAQLDDHLG